MRIALEYRDGKIAIAAVTDECGVVARGEGVKVDEAVKQLVSSFAKMQADTIAALNDSGIIHYVKPEELS